MTQQRSLERQIADWMADEADGPAPDQLLESIDWATGRARPLPRWLAVLKEPAMTTTLDRTAVGVRKRSLALLAILVLLIAALAVGAIATITRPAPPGPEAWPGYRGDPARGGGAVTGPIGNPVVRWQVHLPSSVRSAIAVSGDLAIFGSDDGVLHAVLADTGVERWAVPIAGIREGPFVDAERVYAADENGTVHALALADGHELWASTTQVPGTTYLTALGTSLFAGARDGSLVAIDTDSGHQRWRTVVSGAGSLVHAPAATAEAVVAAADDGSFIAVDPASGAVRWRVDAGRDGVGNPVIADGKAFLGGSPDSAAADLVAYSLADGQVLWRDARNVYAPSVAGGVGYTGSASGDLTAIDLATGTERWVARFQGTVRAPVIAGDIVYASADGERRLVALDKADGRLLWSYPVDGQNDCCIAVLRGTIYVATLSGTVYAIGGDGVSLTPQAVPSVAATVTPSVVPSPSVALPLLATNLQWAVTSGDPAFDPWGLTVAPDGRIWALEGPRDRISIFESNGTFVESWGGPGKGDGQFDLTRGNGDPYGALAFAPDGSFYVLDVGNHRVQHFGADRTFLGAWGSFGSGPGAFNDPVGIVVDDQGIVSVLDDTRNVIESYDASGSVVGSIEAFPSMPINGGANRLSLGPNGDFFVSMVGPNQVLELDRDGSLVRIFGAPGTAGAFTEQPLAMQVDRAGRVYVSQGRTPGGHCVNVYGPDGTYLGSFGEPGGADDQLAFPWGMVVLADGIVVSDPGAMFGGRNLIRKFDPVTFP